MYTIEISTSDELAYEFIKDLAIKNGGKVVSEQVPNNYILPIKVSSEMLSDKGKELLGIK